MARFIRQSPVCFEGTSGRIELLPEGVVYLRIAHSGRVSPEEVHETLLCIHALSPSQRPLLLIDRMQSYWLSFEAQRVLRDYADFAAAAYWIRRPISASVAQFAKETYMRDHPVRVFLQRKRAMNWLRSFQPTRPKMVPAKRLI